MNIVSRYIVASNNIEVGDELIILGYRTASIRDIYQKEYNKIYRIGHRVKVIRIGDKGTCNECYVRNKCYHKFYFECRSNEDESIYLYVSSCEMIFRKAATR